MQTMDEGLYCYRAICLQVVDGDTARLDINLGFSIRMKETVRLNGINTPELHGVADPKPGQAAKEYLKSLIEGKDVVIKTFKDKTEKFGRLLADIYIPNPKPGDIGIVKVNDLMVEAGHAKPYFGGAR